MITSITLSSVYFLLGLTEMTIGKALFAGICTTIILYSVKFMHIPNDVYTDS